MSMMQHNDRRLIGFWIASTIMLAIVSVTLAIHEVAYSLATAP